MLQSSGIWRQRALALAKRLLTARRLPALVAALAVALSLPSLWLGLQLDDHVLRAALTDPPPVPGWSKGPTDVFAFFTGDPAETRQYVDAGFLPWWTSSNYRVAFFRPLAGLTHWIDFQLWPGRLEVMHFHSLIWFGAMVAGAAVFFRRFIGAGWAAGLAALLFAIDDGHGLPAVWLANRNASIAAGFGILALLAHDGWRRTGSRSSLALSLVALVLALLGGELGIATSAYLFAYAICLDTHGRRSRVVSLLPAAAISAAWLLMYWMLGFGAAGSGLYVDPTQPGAFAAAVIERAPVLLFGQWFLPPDLYSLLSQRAARVFWLAAIVLVSLVAVLFAPVLRRERVARFFGLGMVLAVLPACGTFPSGRLLIFVGLGGSGLLALFLASRVDRAPWLPQARAWRGLAAGAFWIFVAIHVVLAPVALTQTSSNVKTLGDTAQTAAATLPADAAIHRQTAVIVNTPSFFISVFSPLLQRERGRPIPPRMLVLTSGVQALRVSRPADNILVIRPQGGLLAPPGSAWTDDQRSQRDFDVRYIYQAVDTLYRDTSPFRVGARLALSSLVIEVTEITSDGRPAEVAYRLETSLDDPSRRWLQWRDGAHAPLPMLSVGETIDLPSATVPVGPWGR